jgi:hypothetical protein
MQDAAAAAHLLLQKGDEVLWRPIWWSCGATTIHIGHAQLTQNQVYDIGEAPPAMPTRRTVVSLPPNSAPHHEDAKLAPGQNTLQTPTRFCCPKSLRQALGNERSSRVASAYIAIAP